jgi:hypothetical protein
MRILNIKRTFNISHLSPILSSIQYPIVYGPILRNSGWLNKWNSILFFPIKKVIAGGLFKNNIKKKKMNKNSY